MNKGSLTLMSVCVICLLNTEVASDGLIEDMAETLNKNYCCLTGHFFQPWSSDFSILSPVGIFDISSYLM